MSDYRTVSVTLSLPDDLVEKLIELKHSFGITTSALVMALLEQPVDDLAEAVINARSERWPIRKFGSTERPYRATVNTAPLIRDYLGALCSRNLRDNAKKKRGASHDSAL